jgi:hypothetical protein
MTISLIVDDHIHCFRDEKATTMFMVGTTTGESVLPVLIGLVMQFGGTYLLPYMMLVCSAVLVAVYLTVNYLGRQTKHFVASSVITEGLLESHNASTVDRDRGDRLRTVDENTAISGGDVTLADRVEDTINPLR